MEGILRDEKIAEAYEILGTKSRFLKINFKICLFSIEKQTRRNALHIIKIKNQYDGAIKKVMRKK